MIVSSRCYTFSCKLVMLDSIWILRRKGDMLIASGTVEGFLIESFCVLLHDLRKEVYWRPI